MKVYLNNNPRDLNDFTPTLQTLLDAEKLPMKGVAVAVNDEVVRKIHWTTTFLKEGDNVTVISMAFGG